MESIGRALVRVVGDCLVPRLLPGDLLYVDRERPARVGDVVVTDWGGVMLIGELGEWEGRRWLVAPAAEPLFIGASVVIVGVGYGLFRQL